MLIQRATLLDGSTVDIRLGARIDDVAAELQPCQGELVVDAAGGTVLPGLHDHHLHLRSAAAALHSVHVGPDQVQGLSHLAEVIRAWAPGADGWIRAVGYHQSVAGVLDRRVLDSICPAVPLRIQDRSGVLWTLNSAALVLVGLRDHPDGRLRSADTDWSAMLTRNHIGLEEFSAQLSAFGVTGVTDATPGLDTDDVEALHDAHRRGDLAQSVHVLAPGKRILHDDDLDVDGLTEWINACHSSQNPVALHCVTAAQLIVALAALAATDRHPGDRIEHAAVVPDASVSALAASGVTVVTQPNFVAERGDRYLRDIPDGEHHELWRLASLQSAGVPLALSTDAPFGQPDPWATMRAAVNRRAQSGAVLNPAESISPAAALMMFFGGPERPATPRRIAPGGVGDLCILHVPPRQVLADLDAQMVAATVIAGQMIFSR